LARKVRVWNIAQSSLCGGNRTHTKQKDSTDDNQKNRTFMPIPILKFGSNWQMAGRLSEWNICQWVLLIYKFDLFGVHEQPASHFLFPQDFSLTFAHRLCFLGPEKWPGHSSGQPYINKIHSTSWRSSRKTLSGQTDLGVFLLAPENSAVRLAGQMRKFRMDSACDWVI